MSVKSKFFTKWGKNAVGNNDIDISLEMFDRAIKADPSDLLPYVYKSSVLMNIRRTEDALNVWEHALIANPDKSEDINMFKSQILSYLEYLSGYQNDSSHMTFEEYVEYVATHKQQIEDAFAESNGASETRSEEYYNTLFVQVADLIKSKEYNKANDILIKLLTKNPKDLSAANFRGLIFFNIKMNKEATEIFNWVLSAQTDDGVTRSAKEYASEMLKLINKEKDLD